MATVRSELAPIMFITMNHGAGRWGSFGPTAHAGWDPELDDMGVGEVELVHVTISGSAK